MGKGMYYEHEPTDLDPRREKLVRELESRGHSETFLELIVKLGLVDAWIAYDEKVTVDAFESLADDSLVVSTTQASDASEGKTPAADGFGSKRSKLEKPHVDTFKRLLTALSENAKEATLPADYSKTPYRCEDYQDEAVAGSQLKPDLAFYQKISSVKDIHSVQILFEAKRPIKEETAFSKYLGQFADYALEVWRNQPLRTFVPLLVLLGCNLYLVVFTREGFYRTTIGKVMFANKNAVKSDVFDVGLALRNLWFLLTLPVSKIGQLNTSKHPFKYFNIQSVVGQTAFEVVSPLNAFNVKIMDRIPQRTPIVGRCAHLFKALYDGKDVILKISSTPTNRLPEGAVYEVLSTTNTDGSARVSGVPHIYMSGILSPDVDGYRIEFLLMEDCGVPVVKYFSQLREIKEPAAMIADKAKKFVENVMQTLVEARHVSVLHRDISTGNVTVKDGRAYVIDWGYAKLLCPPNEPLETVIYKRLTEKDAFQEDIARRWALDWNKVTSTETAKDPFTGTSMYMSVQMLLKVKRRSIFNDIESLFYVILDALSTRPREASTKESPPGFSFYSDINMAFTRIGLLGCDKLCLGDFGVDTAGSQLLENMLCAMHKFLFFVGDRYIGGNLRGEYERQFDRGTAAIFMNKATLDLLDDQGNAAKQEPSSPQRCGPTGQTPDESELPAASSVPQMQLRMPTYQDSAFGDNNPSGGDENANPSLNAANKRNSQTPGASRFQTDNRGGKSAAAHKGASRGQGASKPQTQVPQTARTIARVPLATTHGPGSSSMAQPSAVIGDARGPIMTRSGRAVSASGSRRPRDSGSATGVGRQLKHRKLSEDMDVDDV
ncbi:hypothetical protein H4S07_002463 [Coemansia furcata]|uniref:Uncharacterized protein n=1 Tax=Coemansia furcata TaxID=417177 RepID=A0ACC1LKC0_9FUNG|nr:hypothetical protein H4S07_002463 [Coemansia furcata]